jgi:regulator of sigma E protease
MLLGIIFVIIFLSILILVHEFGHFLAAKKFGLLVEEFGFGLPPRIWSKKIGETIYSINALPFGGFVKIYGEDREEDADRHSSFGSLPISRRAIILSAGVLMNFLLGWFLISLVFSIGIPQAVLITKVRPNTPAAEIGLQAGDKIIGLNDIWVYSEQRPAGDLALAKTDEFVNLERVIDFINEHRGKETVLKIERNNEIQEFKLVPRVQPPAGEGALGIELMEAGLPKQNLLASVWQGLKVSIEMIQALFVAIFNLITKVIVGKATLEQIAGPVGIVKITTQASTLGFVYLLQLLALISLNLAVINFFPFPALDGGRLLFLLIEKIKGSPLPVKFERYANAFGMALLLFLMVVITIKDILSF